MHPFRSLPQAAPPTPAAAEQLTSDRAAPSGVRQSTLDDRNILARAGAAAQARRRAHTAPPLAADPAQTHTRLRTWPQTTLPLAAATTPPRVEQPLALGRFLAVPTPTMAPFVRRDAGLTPSVAATPRADRYVPGPVAPAPRLLRRVPPPPLEQTATRIDDTAATTLEGLIEDLLRAPSTPQPAGTPEPAAPADDEVPRAGPSRERDLPTADVRRQPEQVQRRFSSWLAGERQDFGSVTVPVVPPAPSPSPSLASTPSAGQSSDENLFSHFSDATASDTAPSDVASSARSSLPSSYRFTGQLPAGFDDADSLRRSSIAGHSFLRSLTPTSSRSTADDPNTSAASDAG